jgi:hypothetical protein
MAVYIVYMELNNIFSGNLGEIIGGGILATA